MFSRSSSQYISDKAPGNSCDIPQRDGTLEKMLGALSLPFFSPFLVIFIFVFIFNVSCSLNIGESVNGRKSAKIPIGEFSCMKDVGQLARDYFDSKVSSGEIGLFFDCVSNAINNFEYHNEGREKNHYEASEVQNYLNDFLLNKNRNKITNEFLVQLMDFKVFMVGGQSKSVTRQELKQLVSLIEFVKKQAINLNEYMPYYLGEKVETIDVDNMKYVKAKQAFEQFAFEVGVRFSESQNSYSLKSLNLLLGEVGRFLNWSEYSRLNMKLKNVVDLVGSFKSIMVAGDGHIFNSGDWSPFFQQLSGWVGIYLDSKYFIKENIITYGPGLKKFIKSVNSGFSLLHQAVNRHDGGIISYARIDKLIEVLGDLGLIPLGIKKETLKASVRIFFDKVIGNPNYDDKESVGGVTASALAQAGLEFSLWSENQLFMDKVLSESNDKKHKSSFGILQKTHPFHILNKGIQDIVHSIDFGKGQFYHILPESLQNIVQNIQPFFPVNSYNLTLTNKAEFAQYHLFQGIHNLTYMNSVRAVARLLVRGWGVVDGKTGKSGVSEEQMVEFYDSVKDLGRDLQFMDPRSENSGSRIFMEANLFTFSSDGINDEVKNQPLHHLLNFNEGLELLAFIYGNGERRDIFYKKVVELCGEAEAPLDVFQQKKFSRECFINNYDQLMFGTFDNLPHMDNYITRLNPEESDEFKNELLRISFIPCEDQKWMELTEIGTISLVLSYVEALVLKFDKNSNNKLENSELWEAYPRFRGFIKKVVTRKWGEWAKDNWFSNNRHLYQMGFNSIIGIGFSKFKQFFKNPFLSKENQLFINNWFYDEEDFYQAVFKSIVASGSLPHETSDYITLPWEAITGPKRDIDWRSIGKMIKKFNLKYYNSDYGVSTDRLGILKIIGSISSESNTQKINSCSK